MSVGQWAEQYEMGVYELDLQHRSLLAIANQLHDAVTDGRSNSTIEWMLEELALYTEFHFATEERYMIRYQVEASAEHSAEHAEMIKAIRRFKRKLRAEDSGVDQEIKQFLKHWLVDHIRESDRSLGEAIRARMEEKLPASLRQSP